MTVLLLLVWWMVFVVDVFLVDMRFIAIVDRRRDSQAVQMFVCLWWWDCKSFSERIFWVLRREIEREKSRRLEINLYLPITETHRKNGIWC